MANFDILAFISAMGGMEAVKWTLNWVVNRKTEARRNKADVNCLENENHRKQVNWLEERLTQRDTRIDALYSELHREQTEKQEWIIRCHKAEMDCKELEVKRCLIRGCSNRQPPSEY